MPIQLLADFQIIAQVFQLEYLQAGVRLVEVAVWRQHELAVEAAEDIAVAAVAPN